MELVGQAISHWFRKGSAIAWCQIVGTIGAGNVYAMSGLDRYLCQYLH